MLARGSWTTAELSELWRLWKAGEPPSAISRALGRPWQSVFRRLSDGGGIAPRPRSRSRFALSATEREEISRGVARGEPLRSIARRLGRSPSTASREIERNGGVADYRAALAEANAWERARRPKACKLSSNERLRQCVTSKLSLNWSPEQISGWLKRTYPDDPAMRISHETIYRTLFIQARGALKKELQAHLRTRRRFRHSKRARDGRQGRGRIGDIVPIAERPAEAEDRAVPGHWEGDLLIGSSQSQIATLVERKSRFTMLVKTEKRDATTVLKALERTIKKLPKELRRSITWDRGTEMSDHARFTLATNVKVYFCDPQSPWQRGTNENTNGLLRQYFPKKTSVAEFTQRDLDAVAKELNARPRKTLGFRTPADILSETLR